MAKEQRTAITISRQLASGGAFIGHLIARKLGYRYVDREVLHRAATDLDMDIRDIAGQDEKHSGFVESLLKSFVFGTPEAAYVPPSRRPVYDDELFETESRIIRELAEIGRTVIVGHAGFSVLRGRPRALHVYIHAPMEFRVERLRRFHELSKEEARAELEASDERRETYLRNRTDSFWHDARNFHLCLDAEVAGFERAVEMVAELMGEQ
jgi:cytidylate kinase